MGASKLAKKKNEQVDIQVIERENDELFKELTNKNAEYMVSLNRRLKELGVAKSRRVTAYNEMLKELIELQADAVTARRHFGTVTECAEMIVGGKTLSGDEEEVISPRWMRYLDGALLLGGLFATIYGIGQMSQTANQSQPFGLAQVIGNYIFGGLAMMVLTQYMPKKGQTKGIGKYMFMSIIVMFTWVFVVNLLMAFMPKVLNPIVPGPVLIVIGLSSIALKMYLKKKWDIKGTMF